MDADPNTTTAPIDSDGRDYIIGDRAPLLWRFTVTHNHGNGFDPVRTFVASSDSTPAQHECYSCGSRFVITFEPGV